MKKGDGEAGEEGGVLHAIGLGPGDPELVTIKARKLLMRSSVIFVPTARGEEGRAFSILSALLPEMLEKAVKLEIPMDGSTAKWGEVASSILSIMPEGEPCSLVNEGDPLLYGSFIHVHEALRRLKPDLRVEVVSGIPSFCAAAAGWAMPLASGNEKVVIAPGPLTAEELDALLDGRTLLVLMKLNTFMGEFRRFVSAREEEVEWWCVENCSLPEERACHDLESLSCGEWDYFTLAMVRRRRGA